MKGYMSAIVAIAVLVLVEIFLFTSSETANVKIISGKTVVLENQIRELRALKHGQDQDIDRLRKDAVRFKRQVPASILYGFRDHEKLFAEFLDYLQSPAFAGIDKTFSFADKTKFIKAPVLLHQVSLNFIFHFTKLPEA
ncbi:MAG: hypothetical protein GXP59_10190, partial [Deltaproteobacteria bacterium]|nr:hypothetical protein [Deltaproteobacteria bacterium]